YVPLYNGKPAVLGGYCHCGSSEDVNFIVAAKARYSESSAIIFHEYAHLLLHNAVRDGPLWLNEGLAEYYSTFALKSGDGRPTSAIRSCATCSCSASAFCLSRSCSPSTRRRRSTTRASGGPSSTRRRGPSLTIC